MTTRRKRPAWKARALAAETELATLKAGNGRRKPDVTRPGTTKKITLGDCEFYLIVNVYEDGTPCEMFGKFSSGDESTRGWAAWGMTMASIALQHGCPMDTILRHSRGQKFPPSQLGKASSIPDAIARELMPAETHETRAGE